MEDLTGRVFGLWTVVSFSHKSGRSNAAKYHWLCRCDCGTEKTVLRQHLIFNASRSCGCKQGTHKHSGTPTYHTWETMKQRCLNARHPKFPQYGGRGIAVCDRWLSFENFLADMGDRPASKTLDRIDNDGGYCPENCRWATRSAQQNNRRCNAIVTLGNETMTATEWDRATGIPARLIMWRLRHGWTAERALTEKPRRRKTA